MNDILFFKNFHFNEFCHREDRYTNNSKGTDLHFIGYMKSGRGILTKTDGERLELKKGDMFYIPKGCRYCSHWIPEDGGARFDSIGFLYFPTKSQGGYALQRIELDPSDLELFRPLSESKELSASSIGRLYSFLGAIEDRLVPSPVDIATDVTQRMTVLMRNDPHRSILEYADSCGVSETALYLYVKRALGVTPNRVRQQVLCDKAVRLLETTNLTVEEISGRLGFSSSSYFRKILWSIYEKTPSDIRRESKAI